MKNIIVKTERLDIVPLEIDELKIMYKNEKDDEMKLAYKEMITSMEKLKGFEEWGTNWEIKLKSSVSIGGLCFKCKSDNEGSVEIGYGIYEDYQNHGYATEAVKGVTEWALKQNGVKCVCAQTDEENIISQKVLIKSGFVHDGYGDEGMLFKKHYKKSKKAQLTVLFLNTEFLIFFFYYMDMNIFEFFYYLL